MTQDDLPCELGKRAGRQNEANGRGPSTVFSSVRVARHAESSSTCRHGLFLVFGDVALVDVGRGFTRHGEVI
jgi:hypothetical protein